MKNLEYIIFACIFYEYEHYIKVLSMGNIFIELKLYFDTLKEMYDKNYKISSFLFKDILKSKNIDTSKIEDVLDNLDNEDDNFDYYLDKYLEEYNEKNIKSLFKQYEYKNLTLNELEDKIINDKKIVNLSNSQSIARVYSHEDFEKPIKSLKTGFKWFDNFEGGFRVGELINIAARTSIGKTSQLKMLALNMFKERPAIFSFEMSKERISKDILATLAGVSKRRYAAGMLDTIDQEKVDHVKKNFYNDFNNMEIVDKNIGVDMLCMEAKRLKRTKNTGIIFIDYLQIIRAIMLEKKDLRIKINYISMKLQNLAQELQIPVVVLAQLNRQAEDRKHPILRDLKESGKIEEDADVVWMLANEQWIDENMKTEVILWNGIRKNRNGATGKFFTHFNKVTGFIQDCDYEENK